MKYLVEVKETKDERYCFSFSGPFDSQEEAEEHCEQVRELGMFADWCPLSTPEETLEAITED